MVTDNRDYRPSVSEVTAQIPKEKSAPIADVSTILSQTDNTHPSETLSQLAQLTTPENNSQPTQETSSEVVSKPKPIIPDTISQDQESAKQLCKHAKAEAAKLTEHTPETTPEVPLRELFPDRPSLYEQHHEAYDQERKTIKGFLQRHSEINQLKKAGIKDVDAKQIYDDLRARGVPGISIIKELNQDNDTKNRLELHSKKPLTLEEKITLLKEAPTIIDRLNSVGCNYDFSLENLSTNQSITTLDEQQFQNRRLQLQPLFFLTDYKKDIINFLSTKNANPKVDDFIDYLTKEFINQKNNSDDSFNQLSDLIISIINPDTSSEYITNVKKFIQTAIASDINPDQPITIPENLVTQQTETDSVVYIKQLTSFSSRQQQKFFMSEPDYIDYSQNGIPTIDFYRNFYLSQTGLGERITIPQKTLDLINKPEAKLFYQKMLSLEDPELQRIYLGIKSIYNQFNEDPPPTAEIFLQYLKDGSRVEHRSRTLSTDQISKLPSEDQKRIKVGAIITDIAYKLYGNSDADVFFRYLDFNSLDSYCDQNGQITPELFKKMVSILNDISSIGKQSSFLIEMIPSAVMSNFNEKEQGFWNGLTKLNKPDNLLISSIIRFKTNHNLFFTQDGQPTSTLFETLAKNGLYRSDFFISNLTPEVLASFSPDDQIFWKFLLKKNISLEDKKKIISDNTCKLITNNREQLASNIDDVDFLNNIIGISGKKNESIISGYLKSLTSGVISKEDKPLVLDFLNEFSILTPNFIKGYKEAKQNHTEKLFISSLKEIAQKLTSSKKLSETEYQSPYYQELIQHIYPNNVEKYASYESNDSCSDRSSDLSQFNIKDVYQIDLLSQGEIKVKDGEQANPDLQIQLEKPVLQVLENLKLINFDKEVSNQQLHQQADILLSQINLPDIDLSQLSIEGKLFIIVSESIYHHQNIDPGDLKKLSITYEFVNFEDIRNFIQGTNDKVSQSSNPEYAHLCELSNFYSDRIKEVNKRIIESVSTNPQIGKLLPIYFQSLAKQESQQSSQDNLNKLQTDKLGLTDGFVDQLTKTLKRRFPNKSFTSDQVKRMLHIYETVTQGLTKPKSDSPDKNTQAFYGQLRSQREKTFALLKQLGSDYIDPRSIHLDEINLQQAINLNQSVESGGYKQDEFLAYTAQKFIDIFADEKSQLDTELSKYVSESGTQREILNAYITKTKSSANARMVGGVCVSGDNPIKINGSTSTENMWDMPNYFQMVFQDPENYQCRGLCLLHHFEENGKKILTVSFNPSSTYLYSIDESSLFNGIYDHLKDFASQNGFDIITTSQNKNIRTNRTGGIFEKAIDQKVSQFHRPFSFSETKQFSYEPPYEMKDMDIIWGKQ